MRIDGDVVNWRFGDSARSAITRLNACVRDLESKTQDPKSRIG
jgi:hypothetical protein